MPNEKLMEKWAILDNLLIKCNAMYTNVIKVEAKKHGIYLTNVRWLGT